MAFRGAQQAALWRAAVAMVRSSRPGLTSGALARRLMATNSQIEGQSFAAFQGVARQALSSVQTADRVAARGAGVFPEQFMGRAPANGRAPGGFIYRVLVTFEAQDGPGTVTTAIDYYTRVPVSYAQLQAASAARYGRMTTRARTEREIADLGPDASVTIEVLAAGRF